MKKSIRDEFATAERTENDNLIDLYCDVLMAYMLVESALGEGELRTELGAALDSGDRVRLEKAWAQYVNLPEDIRLRIDEGDANFEQSFREEAQATIPASDADAAKRRTA